MGCRGRLDPREVLRRIIKNIIQRNLRLLNNQVKLLRTYDLAIWESLSQGFIRAQKFVKLSRKIISNDSKFEAEARELIGSLFNRAIKVLEKGKNPDHVARALGKTIRTAVFIGMNNIKPLLSKAIKSLNEIDSELDRVKTASYLLFEVGRTINALNKEETIEDPTSLISDLEQFAQEIYKKMITCITILSDPESRAKALAYLAEGIKDLSIIVKKEDNKVEWLDVHEAELAAQESLKESESVSDFYIRGIIKSYVAYIYYTLSLDLREEAEKLYDEAIELAVKNIGKNEKAAADLLGQIAFTKALIGQGEESETLFQEACVIAVKCPNIENILTALKIADLAGKSRMLRIAGEILDQYIIPAIKSIKDGIKRAALMAFAADVAAWVDINWGARLAVNAAEELWMYSIEDLKDGEEIYLLALGASRAAFADPDSAWRILDFILSILRSDLARLPFFIEYISPKWLGKAYKELKIIPAFWSIFRKELKLYLDELNRSISKEKYAITLIDIAYGIGKSDKKYVIKLLDRAVKDALGGELESKILGRAIKAAINANVSLSDNYMNELLKRAEQLSDFDETINYLLDALEEIIETDQARKLAKAIIDIVSETDLGTKSVSKSIQRFIKLLKRIDAAWANEIKDLIREERGFIDKSNKVFRETRIRRHYQ